MSELRSALRFSGAARQRTIVRWVVTLSVLAAATVAMYAVRGSLDKAHVALVYLLIVLAASAAGGRALGLTVVGLAFLCFDFFFLVPYLTLTARLNATSTARLHEQATMLTGAVSDSIAQLDQVRLPLQILLESPFGALNDNQEELLHDARTAADGIDVALRRLAQVADIDRDALPVQHELVQVNDVVRSVLPLARAAAERNGARTEAALEPGLPRVMGDRTRLAEALALLVAAAAAQADQKQPLVVTTARDGSQALIRIAPPGATAASTRLPGAEDPPAPALGGHRSTRDTTLILAKRLIEAQGGEARVADDALEVRVGQPHLVV